MQINSFSKHIFWSYKPNADLPEPLVVRQVVAYGEWADLRLLFRLVPPDKIQSALNSWKEKDRFPKRINLVNQIFLNNAISG